MTPAERAAAFEVVSREAQAARQLAGVVGSEYGTIERHVERATTAFHAARLALDAYEALQADDDTAPLLLEQFKGLLFTHGIANVEGDTSCEIVTNLARVLRERRCVTCRWWGTDPYWQEQEPRWPRPCDNPDSECYMRGEKWSASHGCPSWEAR